MPWNEWDVILFVIEWMIFDLGEVMHSFGRIKSWKNQSLEFRKDFGKGCEWLKEPECMKQGRDDQRYRWIQWALEKAELKRNGGDSMTEKCGLLAIPPDSADHESSPISGI